MGSDGVLIIVAPKSSTEDRTVAVSRAPVDDNAADSTDNVTQFTLDVPGVKLENLKLVLTNNGSLLEVVGERNVANQQSTLVRRYQLDRTFDANNLTATLSHGVLVVTIPKK